LTAEEVDLAGQGEMLPAAGEFGPTAKEQPLFPTGLWTAFASDLDFFALVERALQRAVV
jgi:hypothetical protein